MKPNPQLSSSDLIELSKSLITSLTKELNEEIAKVNANTSTQEMNEVGVACEGILARIKKRLGQLERRVEAGNSQ